MNYYYNPDSKDLILFNPETEEIQTLLVMGEDEAEIEPPVPEEAPTKKDLSLSVKTKKKKPGKGHPKKIDPEKLANIKKKLKGGGIKPQEIADFEGVHIATVYNIKKDMREEGELPVRKTKKDGGWKTPEEAGISEPEEKPEKTFTESLKERKKEKKEKGVDDVFISLELDADIRKHLKFGWGPKDIAGTLKVPLSAVEKRMEKNE